MSAATDVDNKDTQHFGRLTTASPKTGRPSTFSQDVADRICQHIADGGYATKLERFGLPSSPTLFRWLNENEAFREQYARAREKRAEVFADQIIEIADTCEDPQKGRLQVEARKWVASKLLPRVYGENQRVEVQHTLSETAARVLADLAQRQKEKKRAEALYIDVTPNPALEQGGQAKQDQQVTADCTGSEPIEGRVEAGVGAPRPRRNGGAGGKDGTPSRRSRPKKI